MKKYLPIIIVILLIIGAWLFYDYSSDKKSENIAESQCKVSEMIFYYLDECSWCQRVKSEGTISKIEELGVRVKQINIDIGPVRHQFRGVPTFVIDEKVYSGYRTFAELRELLGCSREESQLLANIEFIGENGEEVSLVEGQITLDLEVFVDGLAHYYNTELLDERVVYFFVLKDKNDIYRAAANVCQVCFDAMMGFRQEGDFMVCNTCGNKYPLTKIATEKGGCNPGPINPNLEVEDNKVIIEQSDLEQVVEFF